MALMEELKDMGVDVAEGLDRVMGDESLYEMMVGMFVDSVRDNPVSLDDFDSGDLEDLIKRVHMLKGVTGNLAMTPLFNGYTETLVLLRDNKAVEAKKRFEQVLPIQTKVIECIKHYQNA